MLRPARMLGLLSSPRSFPTGQPVYSRACSNEGLPSSKSAMTSRLNHLLPRQDLHLLACQRTKAALGPHYLNSPADSVARGSQLSASTTTRPPVPVRLRRLAPVLLRPLRLQR